ncbi:hypothetical protein [Paraconexibacter sp. AEG42_29]
MPALDELGAEIERVAYADAERPRGRRRRWALFAVPAALTLAGAAYAATELLRGEPLRNPPGVVFRADEGVGVPKKVAGAVVAPLRFADPDGGPPWGVRVLKTTRDHGCIQIGRVDEGDFGVLGQDGLFGNDGRFHEWPADVVGESSCAPNDAAGHAFLAMSYSGLPASGTPKGCTVPAQLRSAGRYRDRMPAACPARDLRNVYYGLLGPLGKSVTYRGDDGKPHTVPATPGDGAYLVVVRPTRQRPARGMFIPSETPLTGLISVQYRDGRVCRIQFQPRSGHAVPCPRAGYVPHPPRTVPAGAVRSAVSLSEAPRPVASRRLPDGNIRSGYRRITIRFTARLASDSHSTYRYDLRLRHRPEDRCDTVNKRRARCQTGDTAGTIRRDISAGETVNETLVVSQLRSDPILEVTVRYYPVDPGLGGPGQGFVPDGGVLVGRATLPLRRIPAAERNRLLHP